MKVVILTEGGSKYGFGHITRCLALYQEFKQRNTKITFIINGDISIKHLLINLNYKNFNWIKDQKQLFNLIDNTDIIIIDSYLAKINLYRKIWEKTNKLVYIDDNNRISYPSGIIINGNFLAENIEYNFEKNKTYLLGIKYIFLRKEFMNLAHKKNRKKTEKIVIILGGSDVRGMTPKLLETLTNNFPTIKKKVIITAGFRNVSKIEKKIDANIELIYNPNTKKLIRKMIDADIAITTGGQTLYELLKIGIPTIVLAVAKNQINEAENLNKFGLIEYAGWWKDKNIFEKIILKLKKLENSAVRNEKYERCKNLLDGNGSERIVNFILNTYVYSRY